MSSVAVSVIMPMRNARAYVESAAGSVLAQLDVDLELIVLDDGSTDDSRAVVSAINDPRLHVMPGPQQGISAALNAGIAAAKGEFIARCDADDIYPDQLRLASQVAHLRAHPNHVATCGRFSTIAPDGTTVDELDTGPVAQDITAELQSGKTRTHLGTFLVRRDTLTRIGNFRPYFTTAEDIDLQLRLSEAGSVWYEPRVCYAYRLHDASITHTQASPARQFFEGMARSTQAQRKQTGTDDITRGTAPAAPTTPGAAMSSKDQILDMLIGASWRHHRAGDKAAAIGAGWRAVRASPTRVSTWKNLASLVVKRSPLAAHPVDATPASRSPHSGE